MPIYRILSGTAYEVIADNEDEAYEKFYAFDGVEEIEADTEIVGVFPEEGK